MKKIFLSLLALLVLIGAAAGYCYTSERTPEYAINQLGAGIAARDYDRVARYADLDNIVITAYDESTSLMAQRIEHLHELYPDDWFFRHDTAFMTKYIADRRTADIDLAGRSIEMYLKPDLTPVTRVDGQAHWLANEAEKFTQNYTASLQSVDKQGSDASTATAIIAIKGNDSDYGRLTPELTLRLTLTEQPDGHWRVTRIANVDEMFYPVLKGIEDYWTLQGWQ